ncbi:MAG TPA: histidine kinase [Chitinophagaceae bacterium]|nr:histidine kinase [Chitinophagaceae bacterium]
MKSNIRYWTCQIAGWGGWTMINLFFVYLFVHDLYLKPPEKSRIFLTDLFIEFVWAILATHLLRMVLKKLQWMRLPSKKIIMLFILGVCFTGLLCYYGPKTTARLTNTSLIEYEKKEDLKKAIAKEKQLNVAGTDYYLANTDTKLQTDTSRIHLNYAAAAISIKKGTGWYRSKTGEWQYEEQRKGRFWWEIIFTFILVSLWLLLYMVWHFVEKNRNDQVDRLTLEKTVKELEVKTIKSHINPHFIFNSLNSIRALVDENPQRARKAITELSNILRSSMQVEKMETVPLHKELDIVKDYLALEQMRFEERLKIELKIDEDTLEQPVPPMMLQTLVENAIKHGVSKNINGGFVRICSDFTNQNHELVVQNSGQLNGEINEDGFGIKSTQDRLRFLYQGKARFEIKNINGNMVESRLIMPIDY